MRFFVFGHVRKLVLKLVGWVLELRSKALMSHSLRNIAQLWFAASETWSLQDLSAPAGYAAAAVAEQSDFEVPFAIVETLARNEQP